MGAEEDIDEQAITIIVAITIAITIIMLLLGRRLPRLRLEWPRPTRGVSPPVKKEAKKESWPPTSSPGGTIWYAVFAVNGAKVEVGVWTYEALHRELKEFGGVSALEGSNAPLTSACYKTYRTLEPAVKRVAEANPGLDAFAMVMH